MNNEKICGLKEKMQSLFFNDNSSAVSSIFSVCSLMSEDDYIRQNRSLSDMTRIAADMCIRIERNNKMLRMAEIVMSGAKLPETTFECSDFIGKFAENCNNILSDKIIIDAVECEKVWIQTNRDILEYAFLSFVRGAADKKVKHITLSCSQENEKVTIKMLAKGNMKDNSDPLDTTDKTNRLYVEIMKEIISCAEGAECKVTDSEFSVVMPRKEIKGNINFRESPLLFVGDTFSSFSTMLSDISDYRFF